MNTAVQRVAMLTRDLLLYDPNLICIGRTNAKVEDFKKPFITIDATGQAVPLGNSSKYDGANEKMHYSVLINTPIVMSFFGDNEAYQRATHFSLMLRSQLSRELQIKYNISILNISAITDVKALTGEQYYNRLDIGFDVVHNENISIETLRIDEPQFKFIQK